MNFINRVLIVVGILFAGIVVLFVARTLSSIEFEERYAQFVQDYAQSFSQQWEISDVADKTSEQMLSQVNTPSGQQALAIFEPLGRLVSNSDIEIKHYGGDTDGSSVGVFKFVGTFEHGKGLVTVTVHEREETIQVSGFNVVPVDDGPIKRPLQERQAI